METFFEKIYKEFLSKRNSIKKNYNRVLPFGDYFSERWEKAKYLGFGEGTSIYDNVIIIGDVKVGCNTWIGPNVVLDGSGGLVIGDNCSISAGVQIYTHDSIKWAISGGEMIYEYEKTIIESNCYLGPNVIISKGIIIRKGTIIGANSFVKSSFPEASKIAGNPAKLIE